VVGNIGQVRSDALDVKQLERLQKIFLLRKSGMKQIVHSNIFLLKMEFIGNKMTKKDFALIAEALKLSRTLPLEFYSNTLDYHQGKINQWKDMVVTLSNALQRTNPRFDYDKFIEATGYNEVK
jgi:hypothetical protein